MMAGRSGQVNIYFIISITLFVVLSIYIIYSMLGFYPEKAQSIKINSLYGKAYAISELLVRDKGSPANWSENNIKRLGIATEPYELNMTKIAMLKKACNPLNATSRDRLANATALADEYMVISIAYLNGTSVLKCSPWGEFELNATSLTKRTAQVRRVATLNNQTVIVDVYVG